ncbi:MAG: diguanylate cyclase [Desulfuromonadales bacterium]|nr:diguanylate cyclase [Desulfuromonadales bacterium]
MKKSINIQSLIYRNYLTSSLVPIFTIEVVLLLLYFIINLYISEKNQLALLEEVTQNLQEITSREVTNINNQLKEISRYAVVIQRDHEAFFSNTDACFFPHSEPEFGIHENSVYYKLKNNGGGSLYYSSSTVMGDAEKFKARCSEILDPLLASIVETIPIITQAYLNTWDGMNRIYPFMPNAPTQYGPVAQMEEFNFYYEADAKHNPERKPVWTGAYLDPAGQGWMVSNVFPIYRDDFLEGVSGLDVTIDSFVQNILNSSIPWNASTFMVDKNGMILAMQEKVEQLIKLRELKTHVYNENIKKTVEKPEEYNILMSKNESIKSQMQRIFDSKDRISEMSIDGVTYLVSQEIVTETGWRMITLIEESLIFSPINKLKELSKKIGYIAIGVMILFYIIFFLFLLRKSRKLTVKIATPIEILSTLTRGLGESLKTKKLEAVGIDEIDHLSQNFNTMVIELETRTDALVNSQLREKMREKEVEILERLAITDRLTELYNRRKLDEILTVESERTKRFNNPYGIVLLDIDHFKSVNDTYGHQVGDQVLVDVAKLLKLHTRETDVAGRWGGDEFLIICPETDQNGLIQLAENLRKNIERYEFSVVNTKTSSFGVTVYQQGDEIKDMILRADKALYLAKGNGRNRVEFQW